MERVKTLIVYATAGAGHRRVAEAIYERAKRQGQDVVIADILDYTNPLFRFFYARGYIFLIRYFPFVWRFVFWLTDKKGLGLIRKAIFLFNLINCVGYLRSLRREKYSCVISTHFMATEMSAFAAGDLGFSLINVVTDFSLHRFWLSPGVDKYCLACPDAKDRLVSYGVPADKIVITGIPVAEKFLSVSDKAGLCKKLGLESGLFSVLIMTGEVGMGPIGKIMKALEGEAQLLVVCGKNKGLFRRLKDSPIRNLKAFPLVDNVEELMAAADLLITKAGGATVSEALAMRLPMVFFSLIPGQEEANARFIQGRGAGVIPRDIVEIKTTVLRLRDDRDTREEYRKNAAEIFRPNAAENILENTLSSAAI